ncbi:Glyoxylase, beta-lactamase superfamily II [Granulicella pectinivorans]|uniref:Glyoxylase, beta-lactamase superfamily II n=1 Tax=Granulicella pectinivorans TaxID=474950 RepID=A0A1I6M629_9BACT|nr:MBL fold metallo-hydrolase [Granulicella pectinivorans]SFS11149.1 Glyoxylase, beta-lactamase superfamily II [Granulicella pectinivorans]
MMNLNRRSFLSLPVASIVVPVAEAMAPHAYAAPVKALTVNFKENVPAKGTFPARWICGSESAMDNTDPPTQVHWYNEHTVVLRQNKCYSYEAPFMMLYFGNERVLMVDQGFNTLATDWPLRAVVDECMTTWAKKHGRKMEDMELLLAFSHLHADHYAAQNEFAGRTNTRIMGLTHEEMVGFWGMTQYPEERVVLDLGGREIWIWGSPGHVMSEFAYYDTYTQILYTGDMFYRGRCYISFWQPWFDSMTRLMKFLDEHPVTHVVGCHVEMGRGGEDYPYGVTWQPDEATWQLSVAELRHAYDVAKTITKPGIYFTGGVYLCNQTRGTTTIDKNPYAY